MRNPFATKPLTTEDRQAERTARLANARREVDFHFGPAPRATGIEPSRYSLAILGGINRKGSTVFGGLDAEHPTKSTVKRLAARRTRNRAARRSRQINRAR